MLNIGEQMTKVLLDLRRGVNDMEVPDLHPECEEEWGPDYAIVQGLYYDYDLGDTEYHVFDHDKFREDYEDKVRSLFPDCIVKMYWQSQEIEVYRD